MTLAQGKDILPPAGRTVDVQVKEAAVKKRDQRNDGREGPSRVESFIDSITALLQGEQTDVGVFDGEQFQNAVTDGIVFIAKKFPAQSFAPGSAVCRICHRCRS